MEQSKKKIISQVAIFIVTFAVAFFGTQYLMSNSNSVDKNLKKQALELNRSCPMMVDKDTRLDKIVALENNTIQYNYSLINVVKSDPKFNVEAVKKYIKSKSQENLNTNPEMKEYREKEVSLNYYYKDKNGKFLLDFIIKPEK